MKKYLLDFPQTRQSREYTCGAAALQSILYYYGVEYREDKLVKLLKTSRIRGTNPVNIVKLCVKLGFEVEEKSQMEIEDIILCLKKGVPVLVVFQAWNYSKNDKKDKKKTNKYVNSWVDGHYAVIIGVRKDELVFMDPAMLHRGHLKVDEFIRRWHDEDGDGVRYDRYGIIIHGTEKQYDSDVSIEIM
jgi:predicted double-glycine peptidase